MSPDKLQGIQIDFIGRPMCTDCEEAKSVFSKVGVGFDYRDIKEDREAELLVTKICRDLGMEPAVPVIIIRHETEGLNYSIVFVEPRGVGLVALGATLSALKAAK